MIDIAWLRDRRQELEAELRRRRLDVDVAALAEIDERRRAARVRAEETRARQKEVGQEIASLEGEAKEAAIAAAGEIADEYRRLVAEADDLDARFQEQWVTLPNIPHESVPTGEGEEDNAEIKRVGTPPDLGFPPLDHLELGTALDIVDTERAARMSGSRFGMLMGPAVMVELALVRWAIDQLVAKSFVPVVPPVLVREEALFGTGFFPGDRDQVYAIEQDELFLAGTSEIPIASMHAGEIVDEQQLPMRYTGFSTCFRREAGTYGKDTRGIWRVHQFDKVEMFAFTHPDRSWEEHERLLAIEEELVQALEIPYRVVNVCTGDLGFPAAKKYDIEAWIPSVGEYKEITSCSNTTDYQSRRLRIRYRGDEGTNLVHTLNGTAVAVGRTLAALLENHQRQDGTVAIPEVLWPYTGFEEITKA